MAEAGLVGDDVPPAGERIRVRPTADPRTGGTTEDLTGRLHPDVGAAAVRAAGALGAPVVGLDLLVPDLDGPEHVLVSADARPDLTAHAPQPVAARVLVLLFPETRRR